MRSHRGEEKKKIFQTFLIFELQDIPVYRAAVTAQV